MAGEFRKKPKADGADYLLFSTICVLLAALLSPVFLTFIHAAVNIFAGGRSVSKTLLFLTYLIVLSLIAKIFKNKKIKERLWHKILFLSGIVLGLVANLASFFYFIKENGLNISDWVIVFGEKEISSTSLLHNHVLKGVIGFTLNFFGVRSAENLDAGFVFITSLPKIILIAGIIIVFFLIIWSVILFAELSSGKTKTLSLFTIGYSITSFSLIKNIIDGGLFNHETLIGLAFLLLFIFPEKRWVKFSAIIILLLQVASTLGFYFLDFFNNSGDATHGLLGNFINSISYASLLFAFYYFQKNKLDRKGVLLAFLLTLTVNFSIMGDLGIISYRLKFVDHNNYAILAAYEKIYEVEYEKIGSVGDLNFYQITPDEKITAGDVIEKYSLLDNFYPLTFPYQNCFPHGPSEIYEYQIAVKKELPFKKLKNDFVSLAAEKISQKQKNFFYQVSMQIRPCLPRHLNIIHETWKTAGINNFLILNIKEANDGNN